MPTRYPDWCDDGGGWSTYLCETCFDFPIWSIITVADVVIVWVIVAILWRQRQCRQEAEQRRLSMDHRVRAKRSWRILHAVVHMVGARLAPKGVLRNFGQERCWLDRFDAVAKARTWRKDTILKKDFNLHGVIMRSLGPVIMLAMMLLISFEVHGFFTVVLPWYKLSPGLHMLVAGSCALLCARIYIDYLRTTFTDPGSPQAVAGRGSEKVPKGIFREEDVEKGSALYGDGSSEGSAGWCLQCQGPKPPRCHHCKVCRRCVLKMDHHCPFVSTCVGLRNHRYFCMFLVDLVLGCALLAVLALPLLKHAVRGVDAGKQLTFAHRLHIVSVFVVAVLADLILGPFLRFHLELVALGETTLENMRRCKDLENLREAALQASKEAFSFNPGRLGIVVKWPSRTVHTVHPDTQAAEAGIQEGWRLGLVNGKDGSEANLTQAIKAGSTYTLSFVRPAALPKAKGGCSASTAVTVEDAVENFIGVFGCPTKALRPYFKDLLLVAMPGRIVKPG